MAKEDTFTQKVGFSAAVRLWGSASAVVAWAGTHLYCLFLCPSNQISLPLGFPAASCGNIPRWIAFLLLHYRWGLIGLLESTLLFLLLLDNRLRPLMQIKRLLLFTYLKLYHTLLWIHFNLLCQQWCSVGKTISQGQLIPLSCLFSDIN